MTTEHKNYIANVGFWSFNSGMVPLSAKSEEEARGILMKMLQGHKDVEVFSIFEEGKSPSNKSAFNPPSFGIETNESKNS